jgi:predicted lipoprotein with Yx(FWY)xxD motif
MKTTQISAFLFAAASLLTGFAHAQSMPKVADGILLSANGMTLYNFDKDEAGISNCNGPCATNWPPVAAPATVPAGKYSVITREDGSKQLAYNGKPLYLYAADKKAGERNGDNFKNFWHIVKE